jgi:hypothetical protein
MRTWWGTFLGLGIGLLGGLFGAVFGALIGILVDLVAVELRAQRAAVHYLRGGDAPSWLPLPIALAGNLVGHVYSVSSGVPLDVTQELAGRLKIFFPDAFARRPVERMIAASCVCDWIGDERWCDAVRRETHDQTREALFRAIWETLVFAGEGSGARRSVHELARRAGLSPQFIDEELRLGELRDAEACAVLGVPRDAGRTEVRAAYRRLVAHFHPDTATLLSEDQQRATEDAFKRIQAAYERLCDDNYS